MTTALNVTGTQLFDALDAFLRARDRSDALLGTWLNTDGGQAAKDAYLCAQTETSQAHNTLLTLMGRVPS